MSEFASALAILKAFADEDLGSGLSVGTSAQSEVHGRKGGDPVAHTTGMKSPLTRKALREREGNWSLTFTVEGEHAILGLDGKETPLYYLIHVGIPEEGVPLRLSRMVDILGETFGVGVVFVEVEIAERFGLESTPLDEGAFAKAVHSTWIRMGR
jgi:hypothetical protein